MTFLPLVFLPPGPKKINLYRNFLKNRTAENKCTYLAYRNCYNKTVRAAKKLHFNSKIDLNCNPKNAWEFLNQAIVYVYMYIIVKYKLSIQILFRKAD